MLAGGVLVVLGLGLQVYCVLAGWYLLWNEGAPLACGGSRGWLLLYLLALTQPFSMLVGVPLLLVISVWGGSLLVENCRRPSPEVDLFMIKVAFFSLLSCTALALAALLLRCARRRLANMQSTANEATARRIVAEVDLVEPKEEAECIICLGGGEDRGEEDKDVEAEAGGKQRWRRLHCGHALHEDCLLEWLLRARRCPLCSVGIYPGDLAGAGAAANHSNVVVVVD